MILTSPQRTKRKQLSDALVFGLSQLMPFTEIEKKKSSRVCVSVEGGVK